jgi:chromosome partitioning protein
VTLALYMNEVSPTTDVEETLEQDADASAEQSAPVGIAALEKMAEVAQGILKLARKRALAPNLEKPPRRYTLTEVAELVPLARKTLEYAIQTKDLPKGESDGRKRLFSLRDVEEFRRYAGSLPWRGPKTKPAIITVANFKGGVGKTSTTVHLLQYFARRGYRTLGIDLDPQASLTTLFGLLADTDVPNEATALPYFNGDVNSLSGVIRKTHWYGLDLIPANLALSDAEFTLARRAGKSGETGFIFYRPLKEGLEEVGKDYDVIVIDTAPAQGFTTMNALFAATALLVPLTPAMMDFASVALFFEMLKQNLEVLNDFEGSEKTFDFVRVLLSKFEANNKVHQQIERWVRKGFPGKVLAKNLALSAALRTGPDMLTAYEASPESDRRTLDRRTLRRAIEYLDDVNEEVEGLVREQWLSDDGTMAPHSEVTQ